MLKLHFINTKLLLADKPKPKFYKRKITELNFDSQFDFVNKKIKHIYLKRKTIGDEAPNENTQLRKYKKSFRTIQKLKVKKIMKKKSIRFEYFF